MWGSGPGDVYAVGLGGTIVRSAGKGDWSAEPSPTPITLTAVWGSAASDVYAVGYGGTILHSDGEGVWRAQTSGVESGNFLAVWGSGAGDVWVAGQGGMLLHSVGDGAWTILVSPTAADLHGLWGRGAGDLYAVGRETGGAGLVLHSTDGGKSWQRPLGVETGGLLTVAGRGAEVWTGGAEGTLFRSAPSSWTPTQVAPTTDLLTGVWIASDGAVFVVSDGSATVFAL